LDYRKSWKLRPIPSPAVSPHFGIGADEMLAIGSPFLPIPNFAWDISQEGFSLNPSNRPLSLNSPDTLPRICLPLNRFFSFMHLDRTLRLPLNHLGVKGRPDLLSNFSIRLPGAQITLSCIPPIHPREGYDPHGCDRSPLSLFPLLYFQLI